jgi:hypothetical protein
MKYLIFAVTLILSLVGALPGIRGICGLLRSFKNNASRLPLSAAQFDTIYNQFLTKFGCPLDSTSTQTTTKCYTSGCGGSYCQSQADINICIQHQVTCYDKAKCEVQSNGACGWTSTPEYAACQDPASTKCYTSSCGGSYCKKTPDSRQCIQYQKTCYDKIKCEIQTNGDCGWTTTAEFAACSDMAPVP